MPDDSLPRWLQRLRPRTLQNQMRILVSAVVLAQLLVSGAIFATFIAASSKAQIGKRALDLAHSVASMPLVHHALEQGDPHDEVQNLTQKIRTRTGAEFIVV